MALLSRNQARGGLEGGKDTQMAVMESCVGSRREEKEKKSHPSKRSGKKNVD